MLVRSYILNLFTSYIKYRTSFVHFLVDCADIAGDVYRIAINDVLLPLLDMQGRIHPAVCQEALDGGMNPNAQGCAGAAAAGDGRERPPCKSLHRDFNRLLPDASAFVCAAGGAPERPPPGSPAS